MIIAVDFDGTLCEHGFPEIGQIRPVHQKVIDFIKMEQKKGSTIILWTCRENTNKRDYLDEAVKWCKEKGIILDHINEAKVPDEFKGAKSRKIFADIYLDDRAVNIKDL